MPQGAAGQSALSVEPSSCVFRAGDDLRWAASGLDESGWLPASQWNVLESMEPHFWLRCRLDPRTLAAAVRPVLQISGDMSYEVFVDGQVLGASGDVRTGSHTVSEVRQFRSPLFADRGRPFLLAVRMTYTPTIYGQQFLPQLSLGDATYQRGVSSIREAETLRTNWIVWLCYVVIGAAAIFFLTLFLFDRSQLLLLWIGLAWLCLALLRLDEFLVAASIHFPSRLELVLYALGNFSEAFIVLFCFALAGRPVNRFFQLILAIILADSGAIMAAVFLPLRESMTLRLFADISPQVNSLLTPVYAIATFALVAAFWPLPRMPRSQVPVFCVCLLWMAMEGVYMGTQIPWLFSSTGFFFLRFQAPRSVAIAVVVAGMTLLLIQRIRTTNRDRAALAGEMQAAREMQRLLVPAQPEIAPGLQLEAAFLPAQQVGGDFYRCRVLADGSQWILLGDVSGKGTAAGMTGAMLLGTSEGHESDPPEALLARLNRVLCTSRIGGFVTAVVLRVWPDGQALIASAGHLAPYLNGRETPVAAALPLGLDVGTGYEPAQLMLDPDDQLTLLTDGVVEARDKNGELFGFERTREISRETAESIAAAAQQFGQEDDITVLTVRRLAAAV